MLKNNLFLSLVIALILALFISISAVTKSESCCPFPFLSSAKDSVKTDKIVLKIEGMTCQECVKKVIASLKKIKGVKKVEVNLKDGEVTIEYEKNVATKEDIIIEAIEKLGFKAKRKVFLK